jgi:hypothetical protein
MASVEYLRLFLSGYRRCPFRRRLKVPEALRFFWGTSGFRARCHPGQTEKWRFAMADREIHHHDSGGMGGMGAILGMILGVLLVGGLIFFFAGNWDGGTKLTVNTPSAPSTTGSAPSAPSPAPSR